MVTTYAIWLTTKVINVDHMNTQREKRDGRSRQRRKDDIYFETRYQVNQTSFFILLALASTTKNKLVALLFFFFYFFSETYHLFPVPPRPSHKNINKRTKKRSETHWISELKQRYGFGIENPSSSCCSRSIVSALQVPSST